MCGGSGTRLWPWSRPSRPKQFIPLHHGRSLFQDTVLRMLSLVGPEDRIVVIGGAPHASIIDDQLSDIHATADILIEPEGRDSAPAMAVAAEWVRRRDPDGLCLFLASDHHIADAEGFREAIDEAIAKVDDRIIVFGVQPDHPSASYGYIEPATEGFSPVRRFVEKPSKESAVRYIDDGCLWNSGNVLVSASVLLEELALYAPDVREAVRHVLPAEVQTHLVWLDPAFAQAPRISIDYALMEHTRRAWVQPMDVGWSDLGAWDAMARIKAEGVGDTLFEDVDDCLVRACDGMMVVAIGVSRLAIVVERDAVLVCDLSRSQDVKKVIERLRSASPRHLDFPQIEPDPATA